MANSNKKYGFFIENSEIERLVEQNPHYQIWVSIGTVYMQIARFNQNPRRTDELKVLKKAALAAVKAKGMDAQYVCMSSQNVLFCFGQMLNRLPQNTFVKVVNVNSKTTRTIT